MSAPPPPPSQMHPCTHCSLTCPLTLPLLSLTFIINFTSQLREQVKLQKLQKCSSIKLISMLKLHDHFLLGPTIFLQSSFVNNIFSFLRDALHGIIVYSIPAIERYKKEQKGNTTSAGRDSTRTPEQPVVYKQHPLLCKSQVNRGVNNTLYTHSHWNVSYLPAGCGLCV